MEETKYTEITKARLDAQQQTTSSVSAAKLRAIRTAAVLVCYAALGMATNVTGPTLVHMRHILHADIATIALAFSCSRAGFLLGSLLCGVVYDRVNAELQLFISVALVGIFTVIMPWSQLLYGYFALNALQSAARGYLGTAAQPYVIALWAGDRLKDPMLQGLHALWSMGQCLAPFIIAPFLAELPQDVNNHTQEDAAIGSTTAADEELLLETAESAAETGQLERVRYSFVVIGIIMSATSLLLLPSFCLAGPTCLRHKQQTSRHNRDHEKQTLPTAVTYILVPVQAVIFFCYIWCQGIPGEMLTSFVIEGLGWEVRKGPWITSLFWGATTVGRVINTPLSLVLSPTQMLTFNLFLTTVAYVIMAFCTHINEWFLWISVAMAGFALSSTFAATFLWNSNVMAVTGAIAGVFMAGTAVGGVVGSALAGYLFDYRSHMWVVYLSLIAALGHVVLFGFSTCLVRCFKPRSKSLRQEEIVEIK